MSNDQSVDRNPGKRADSRRTAVAALVGVAVGVVVLVLVGLLLRERVPGNMGNGFLLGGLVALAAFALALWRGVKRPDSASSFERAFTQTGDERDDAVLTRAFAFLGALTLPLTGGAAIAIALGAEVPMVLTILMLVQAVAGAAAFVVISRRS